MKTVKRLLPLAGCVWLMACYPKAAPEEYLIPAGFTGKVNILFGRSDGAAKAYDDGRRVYQIPADGLLVTQFPATAGFVNRKYYTVDPAGHRTPLEIFGFDHNSDGSVRWLVSDKTKKGVFLDGTSGEYGNHGEPGAVQYQEFVVSSKEMLDSFFTQQYLRAFDGRIQKVTGLTLHLK